MEKTNEELRAQQHIDLAAQQAQAAEKARIEAQVKQAEKLDEIEDLALQQYPDIDDPGCSVEDEEDIRDIQAVMDMVRMW